MFRLFATPIADRVSVFISSKVIRPASNTEIANYWGTIPQQVTYQPSNHTVLFWKPVAPQSQTSHLLDKAEELIEYGGPPWSP